MTHPPPLPGFWELDAPADWTAIDFISDLHLAPDTPRTFEAWATYLRETPASAVFILGDLFEVWVGDDARHAGFEARCADALAEAATRITVAFMCGNRDFLVGGELLRECGVRALSDPTVLVAFGERLLLAHGDALCLDDHEYQAFRRQVRSSAWQRDFLAKPLAERQRLARAMRDHSEQRKRTATNEAWVDIDKATAVRWMHEAGTPTLVHGHTHRPAHEDLAPGFVREVLSDWDCDSAEPPRAEVLRLKRAGLDRIPLAR
ncbi:UDP-2,3-diacylglucosamine diphosphatase [uncultured Piscinibacter sp.]|uniref:UDP-2,3-diacylglucosamine diphosphatase n=1 Tax=uncultured Piscinibacter sp. TaxID=1131835 RepID=UPI00261449F2|nr:UDP-2,3-diacylglucosamine diphosphatase [uncultured Piscinibacter sp.]